MTPGSSPQRKRLSVTDAAGLLTRRLRFGVINWAGLAAVLGGDDGRVTYFPDRAKHCRTFAAI
jgi:hypothetical protein